MLVTLIVFIHFIGGQSCVDAVSAQQRGNIIEPSIRQVIVPRSHFSCNGRITGYAIGLLASLERTGDFPVVQVWHPVNSTFYTRVGTACELTEDDINRSIDFNNNEYHLGLVQCPGNNLIEFQSGDVIGFHQSDTLLYQLWSNNTNGYTAYYHRTSSPLVTFDINSATIASSRQPLIEVMYGKNVIGMLLYRHAACA